MSGPLRRLLRPRSVAVVGGAAAEEAVRACRAIGYDGVVWPVNPTRASMAGVTCLPDLQSLPGVPDAALVAVSREQTIAVVAQLAGLGAGGVVCHASGFAEDGIEGRRLQDALVAAAGGMALVGPNCLVLVNYLDGVALWAEQHGGSRVLSGVGVVAQSGNIGQNITMQRRSMPLAQLVNVGNGAVTGVVEVVDAMLDDPRITAIGLHLEELPEVAGLSRVALKALERRVPIVALKTGSSVLGAQVTLSHTSSLAGSDTLCDAVFGRLGIARVHRIEALLETLTFLHTHGSLPDARVSSASCSGGEAAHVADLAHRRGVTLPDLPEPTARRLRAVLGDRVPVRNPLDYHTYVWGREDALTECFTAFLGAGSGCHLLVLDLPRDDRCDVGDFELTVRAFLAAHAAVGSRACVVSSLPEGLQEELGRRLLAAGIAPMHGIADCLDAVVAARAVGRAQARASATLGLETPVPLAPGRIEQLDEPGAKAVLAAHGVPVPVGATATAATVGAVAERVGYPVVVKSVSSNVAHKTERGGVRTGLRTRAAVEQAAAGMDGLGDRLLVERMVEGTLVELVVGVHRDPHVGLCLTIGAGGVLVELLRDTVTLLLPSSRGDIRAALETLRIWPLLAGHRGRSADVESVVNAVSGILDFVEDRGETLVEVEVNPLLVLADSVVAVDALVRLHRPGPEKPADRRHDALEGVR